MKSLITLLLFLTAVNVACAQESGGWGQESLWNRNPQDETEPDLVPATLGTWWNTKSGFTRQETWEISATTGRGKQTKVFKIWASGMDGFAIEVWHTPTRSIWNVWPVRRVSLRSNYFQAQRRMEIETPRGQMPSTVHCWTNHWVDSSVFREPGYGTGASDHIYNGRRYISTFATLITLYNDMGVTAYWKEAAGKNAFGTLVFHRHVLRGGDEITLRPRLSDGKGNFSCTLSQFDPNNPPPQP